MSYIINKLGMIITNINNRDEYKSETKIFSEIFLALLLLVCLVANFANFTQMFTNLLYDSLILRFLIILEFLAIFDLVPVICSFYLKKKKQGYVNDVKVLLIILGTLFLIGAFANMYLRIYTRNIIFPDLSVTNSALNSIPISQTESSRALPLSIILGLLPILIGCLNAIIGYSVFDFVKAKAKSIDNKKYKRIEEAREIEATIKEYKEEENFREKIYEKENIKKNVELEKVESKRKEYISYVQLMMGIALGTPEDYTKLSRKVE